MAIAGLIAFSIKFCTFWRISSSIVHLLRDSSWPIPAQVPLTLALPRHRYGVAVVRDQTGPQSAPLSKTTARSAAAADVAPPAARARRLELVDHRARYRPVPAHGRM